MFQAGYGYNILGPRHKVSFPLPTANAAGSSADPDSALVASDFRIYRCAENGALDAAQRASTNGVTVVSPFDSLTGGNSVTIDLSDNSDSGFYDYGYDYYVTWSTATTLDGQTIRFGPLCHFHIGLSPDALCVDEGIAQSVTSTTLVLRAGTAYTANDSCKYMTLLAYGSTQGYWQSQPINGYTSSTKTVAVNGWQVTPSGTVIYCIIPTSAASNTNAPVVDAKYVNGQLQSAVDIGAQVIPSALRSALGLASNNLDTQLSSISSAIAAINTLSAFAKGFMTNWKITNITQTSANLRVWPVGTAHINGTGELAIIPLVRADTNSDWTEATL